ncbi:polo-like protein kinase [Trypanosoma brucei brucei TREU927]|uniref:Serine/threonine-protein kinase PLK n=1 Tax=Trypanosoma brucei brucei (strain 927/4 GUTat10.1) TaxID=185431 RepID=Q57VI0_TRYB2|nr:polo-like protein kinase [Trypanosoma brucei brucei TREU927]AAX70389.1 polo-like protein kinase [Trypanosoma brucei]AAZ12695.1 polo-like protein kinase [Trypanosoma brucei brucei TREU927]
MHATAETCETPSSSRRPPNDRPDFREGSTLKEFDKSGRLVGYFRCGRMLGRGGFAKCYEVEQGGDTYALKVVDRSLLQKTKTLQKLHSEISIHRRMKHKHIVNFIRTFHDDWNVYILLEKCSNQTLMEILKRRQRFSVPETQYIALQSLSAIQYMHEQCVIHRDLKLGNIMMDANMNVKIGDFGLAAELQYDGERKRTICGTPNYIAPEIIEGSREGHSYEVDVWSLGVILYTLLVGEPPFQTSDVKATYRRIRQCRYEFPSHVDVPESGKELIHSILQSRPDQRPTLLEIRSHPFFRLPPPPTTAPTTLFYSSRRRQHSDDPRGHAQGPLPLRRQKSGDIQAALQKQTPQRRQPQSQPKSVEAVRCISSPRVSREVLQPISTNLPKTDRYHLKPSCPAVASARFHGALGGDCNNNNNNNNNNINNNNNNNINSAAVSIPSPRADAIRPLTQVAAPGGADESAETTATTPRVQLRPHPAIEEEEKNELTAVHDQLHQTLREIGDISPREVATRTQTKRSPQVAPLPVPNSPTTSTVPALTPRCEDEPAPSLPLPTVWVTSFADFSEKYGLCYRLSTGHTGVHFNDSTKMVWEPITNRVEYYMRVKEVVARGNANVLQARDQQHAFHMDMFPESLTKKVTLIKYFKSYLSRTRNSHTNVEVVRCSPYVSEVTPSLSGPHMIEDIVYVKRWLITPQAIIFRLSNKTIQVCFHDKAEVILSSESRVVTYTEPTGNRVTMSLSSVATRSREIAARLRYTKDILSELIQNRDI